MAVLLQSIWGEAAAPTETMLADLNLDEAALAAGRLSLTEHGVLVMAPGGKGAELSPAVGPVLSTVTRPQVLGVLQVTTTAAEPRNAYFSWTPERIVFNQVTETGDHILDTLPGLEAIGEAVIQFSRLTGFEKARGGLAADPEAVVQAATLRALFLAVSDPAAADPGTEASAWLVSGDGLWLVKAGAGQIPQFMPATAAEVAKEVVVLMNAAVERIHGNRTVPRNKRDGGSGVSPTAATVRRPR